jgi:hypothetical protein
MTILPDYIKRSLPKLNATRALKDPLVICKFFDPVGISTWFVIEGEELSDGNVLFYGLVMGIENVFEYFTLFQLIHLKDGVWGRPGLPLERDGYFKPCKLSKVLGK